jgi:predicted house-cleaning NTP pyrophosphatase (Maf/HAM1 superfamily)
MTPEGWQGEKGNPIIEGDIPEWVPTDTWTKKAGGGTVETGDIARRQSLVPPLSGPDPQGIMGLPYTPKQVRVS